AAAGAARARWAVQRPTVRTRGRPDIDVANARAPENAPTRTREIMPAPMPAHRHNLNPRVPPQEGGTLVSLLVGGQLPCQFLMHGKRFEPATSTSLVRGFWLPQRAGYERSPHALTDGRPPRCGPASSPELSPWKVALSPSPHQT